MQEEKKPIEKEENTQPQQELAQTQEESAETQEQKDIKKEKTKTRRMVESILLSVAIFFGGMTTGWFLLEPEFRSLIKMKIAMDAFYYQDVEDDVFFDAIFDAVNENVLDEYSYYMSADEHKQYESEGEGNRSGLGIAFFVQDENGNAQMYISDVCGNSPAERAGVQVGDYLLGFGLSQTQLKESVIFQDFSNFLSGLETGQVFYIKVRKGAQADAPIEILSLAKEYYVENYVFYRTATSAYGFTGASALDMTEVGTPLTCLGDETAYIQLTSFNGNAAEEFQKAMDKFRADGKKNLVLDLRGNGGGYIKIARSIASYFCKNTTDKKPLIGVADYGGYQEKFRADGNYYNNYFSSDSRICVLADVNTASASEFLIGAMIDYGTISYGDICLSELGGMCKTYGKGIMQTTYPLLLGGDVVKLTTAVMRWPISNHCIHGRGILVEDGALSVPRNWDFDAGIADSLEKLFSN